MFECVRLVVWFSIVYINIHKERTRSDRREKEVYMGNQLLKELKALKKSCDDMLENDRKIFKDNKKFLSMAERATYESFYEVAAFIIKTYEELEEKEAADYENFLYGGKNNEV